MCECLLIQVLRKPKKMNKLIGAHLENLHLHHSENFLFWTFLSPSFVSPILHHSSILLLLFDTETKEYNTNVNSLNLLKIVAMGLSMPMRFTHENHHYV